MGASTPDLPRSNEKQNEIPTEEEKVNNTLEGWENKTDVIQTGLVSNLLETLKKWAREKLGDDPETEKQMKQIAVELREIENIDNENKENIARGLDKMKPEHIRDRITTCVQKLEYINALFQHPNPKVREWAGQNNENLSKLRASVNGRRGTMENYLANLDKTPAPAPAPAPAPNKPKYPEIGHADNLINYCETLATADSDGITAFSKKSAAEKNDVTSKIRNIYNRLTGRQDDARKAGDQSTIDQIQDQMNRLTDYYKKFTGQARIPRG